MENERIDAIGIFKSEIKQDFLQFEENNNQLTAMLQQGVNLNKLDKGCLIFNTKVEASEEGEETSYKVLSVDSNRSEEHTSELQSRGQLVCRLLLEKKHNTIV